MKLWAVQLDGAYAGGVAICAAPDPETAKQVAKDHSYGAGTAIHGLEECYDPERILNAESQVIDPCVLYHYEWAE